MKIKQIINQNRRDFNAIYECEHCGNAEQSYGYDDVYFHHEVIPNMECTKCGKKSDENYRVLETKYQEGLQL